MPPVATSARSLLANSLWNGVGMAGPALVAIPSMGALARLLAPEAFGLLTLAWALVGYFSMMDLGIARAVCWLVARDPHNGRFHSEVVRSGMWAAGVFALLAAAVIGIAAEPLVLLLRVSPDGLVDAVRGLRALAVALPLVVLTTIAQAGLEGLQHFKDVGAQRSAAGILMSLAPVAAVLFLPTFESAVWALVVARALAALLAFHRLAALIPLRLAPASFAALRRILQYGGWIAFTAVIHPLFAYADRFLLSSYFGTANVAAYAAPSELVARATSMPVAISRAMFPAISDSGASASQRSSAAVTATRLVLLSSAPVVLILVFFAQPLTQLWLGEPVAQGAAPVLRVLAIGLLFNSLAQLPFSALHAAGHSRATAMLHALEAVPYLLGLVYVATRFGAVGIAWAWTARVAVDWLVLTLLARRFREPSRP